MKKPTYKFVLWFYGISLLIIASLRFMPFLNDAQGHLFGIFHLDWLDDVVHTVTGVAAIVAVLKSKRWSTYALLAIGALYTTDAFIGFVYGQNPLHIGFWTGDPLYETFISRVLINGPHLLGGGFALAFGIYLLRKSRA